MTTLLSLLVVSAALAAPQDGRVPLTAAEAAHYGLSSSANESVWRNADAGNIVADLPKGVTPTSLTLSARQLRSNSSDGFLDESADGRYCHGGSTSPFADMQLPVENGMRITGMRVFGFDNTLTSEMTVSLIERCTPNNAAGSFFTSIIAEITPLLSNGNFSLVTAIGANNVVDSDICTYTVRARLGQVGDDPPCGGVGVRLQKVRFSIEAQ